MSVKKKFEGNIKSIKPSCLIKDKNDELGKFFLVLSLVFNDLKDIITLDRLFRDNFELPNLLEISPHLGEYGGLTLRIERLYAGLVHEFFNFLNEQKAVLNSFDFRLILKKIPSSEASKWSEIESIALEKNLPKSASEFSRLLLLIRNNISYHYDQSGKNLYNGFSYKFFQKTHELTNKSAYYSLGDRLATTRFYYADAAAQEYIAIELKKLTGSSTQEIELFKNYQEKVRSIMEDMNNSIFHLLNIFILIRNK